jgi:anti-sigma28 factor (negative regulator of flagellin synthesis)
MRISDIEVKKLLTGQAPIVDAIVEIGQERQHHDDQELVKTLTADVMAMDDREEMIASLKARIAAGEYAPSGEEIVDTMIRRAIADRIR